MVVFDCKLLSWRHEKRGQTKLSSTVAEQWPFRSRCIQRTKCHTDDYNLNLWAGYPKKNRGKPSCLITSGAIHETKSCKEFLFEDKGIIVSRCLKAPKSANLIVPLVSKNKFAPCHETESKTQNITLIARWMIFRWWRNSSPVRSW